MENARTLDYYASNNESEFLAQAYPAFLSPVKVHALNHKAFNTRSDLETRDPDTFDFVASLIRRQEAYLEGDSTALKSNWAQTFVALSEENRDAESVFAPEALLDTALMWDDRYLPAFVSYGALLRDAKRFDEASQWLQRALVIDSTYAPVYAAYADLVGSRALAGDIELSESLQLRVGYYGRALDLETDYAVRARLNGTLRSLYRDHGYYPQAIRVSEEYMVSGPTVSTYLRDRRDDAAMFAGSLRSAAGYSTETLPFFSALVGQKPQHYGLRGEYADALAGAGRFDEAVATLEEAQRILRAAGRPNQDYMIQMAEYHLAAGDRTAATEALDLPQAIRMRLVSSNNRLARVLARLGDSAAVQVWLDDLSGENQLPAAEADVHYTNGWIAEAAGDLVQAEASYRAAVELDPYRAEMRLRLMAVLVSQRKQSEARRVRAAAVNLELPMGPDFQRRADDILSNNE
jgi:Tfp pilus assembly protein PilF